ncbi:sensor histidine kinase [Cohnella yongneupensis]|uniref:histidine kinase n=1 Tax=Cohnella yongneupensis TaxID=425006 RepID=A0ABW0QYV9_9BACL
MTSRLRSAWQPHIPLVRTFLILLVLLSGVGWTLSVAQTKDDSIARLDVATWQWAPATSYDEIGAPSEGWHAYEPGSIVPTNIYWVRIPLPQTGLLDPHLKVNNVGSLKVYDGHSELFSYLLAKINISYHWKMASLPSPLPPYIDMLLRYKSHGPITADAALGNKSDFIALMLRQDMDNLVLGVLLLFSGGISIGLYKTQRNRLYIYFSLLAFFGGYAALVRNELLQAIVDYPVLGYWQDACMPIATFAFVGAMREVFPGVHRRTLRVLWYVSLAVSALAVIGALISQRWYSLAILVYTPVFLVVFAAVYWTIWVAYRKRRDLESIWIMAGFSLLAAIALLHMYRFVVISYVPQWLAEETTAVDRMPKDLLFWGLFAFVVCLIRVILYRYMAMNRQLVEFNRSLEHVVHTRTHELQERTEQLQDAHERLAASMRENAEALAESMIMEERHRITGSIHDTVGHTLSDTVVQLEDAKLLISQDREQAELKLAVSQELLRKGLEDIRQSVRMLKEDAGHYDLTGAIGALIRETEQATGCTIGRRIGKLPGELSTLQKRLLFQTLQEGINIGLKQREPVRLFLLSVWSDPRETSVQLRLSYDGSPISAADWGVGIRSLAEQADRLGGELKAADTDEGSCLTLTIPTAMTNASSWII